MQTMIDLLNVATTQDKEKTELLREKYQKEVERYDSDKDSIAERAKDHEHDRDLLRAKADRFDAGEGILEISLAICSLTLLPNKKFFCSPPLHLGTSSLFAPLHRTLLHPS